MKKYRYNFIDLGLEILADNGDEAEKEYKKNHTEEYGGVIELYNNVTGEFINKLVPIKFN